MGATNNIIFNENRRTVISWLSIPYSSKANALYDTEHWYLILSSIKIKISWPIWKFWAFRLENRFSIDFFSNQISTPSCYLNVNQTINLFNFGAEPISQSKIFGWGENNSIILHFILKIMEIGSKTMVKHSHTYEEYFANISPYGERLYSQA